MKRLPSGIFLEEVQVPGYLSAMARKSELRRFQVSDEQVMVTSHIISHNQSVFLFVFSAIGRDRRSPLVLAPRLAVSTSEGAIAQNRKLFQIIIDLVELSSYNLPRLIKCFI